MSKNAIEDFSNPSKKYRNPILSGAKIINLPTSYIHNRILKNY